MSTNSSLTPTPAADPTIEGLPPGPSLAFVQLARFVRNSDAYLAAGIKRYGDPFHYRAPGISLSVTANPEIIEQIYGAPAGTFGVDAWVIAPLVGENSLLGMNGERHQRDRKLLMPPFHGARMRTYGAVIREAALEASDRIQPGESFRALELTQHITIEVILRAVFGVVERSRRERYRHAIAAWMESVNPLFLMVRSLRHPFFPPWRRYSRALATLDALIFEEIEQRQQSQPGEDILSLMMAARYDDGAAMSRQELRDQLLTLLLAGHETSAVSIAWALYELHRNPTVLEKLLDEVESQPLDCAPDDLMGLPYLEAVCKETLRLHPVTPNVPKQLNVQMKLGKYLLPAGAGVTIAFGAVHQRPDLYPEPTLFRPERFLERKFGPFEFLPFGGGNRRCIGAAFAMYEIKLVLAELLRRYRFRLSRIAPERTVLRSVTLGPANGVPMVLERN
ncbi:MAG: cytochrome P450 [Gemmatimonas sp.]